MPLWNELVDILREAIFAYAQACNGNLAAGIVLVTLLVRLALTPLGIRLARAATLQQRAMTRIRPDLDALRKRYSKDPRRLAEETSRVMVREKIRAWSPAGCLGGLVQLPFFVALYSAVRQAASAGGRFLWIRNLAQPDWVLAGIATLATLLVTAAGAAAPAPNRSLLLAVSGLVTLVVLSKLSAGVALYWASSSLFGAGQTWLVQRSLRRSAA